MIIKVSFAVMLMADSSSVSQFWSRCSDALVELVLCFSSFIVYYCCQWSMVCDNAGIIDEGNLCECVIAKIPVTHVPTCMLPVSDTLSVSSSITSSSLSSVNLSLEGCGIKLCCQQNEQGKPFNRWTWQLVQEKRLILLVVFILLYKFHL